MAGAPPHPDRLGDPARLHALARSGLLTLDDREPMERLARMATRTLGTPAAVLSAVTDEHRLVVGSEGPDGRVLTNAVPIEQTVCHLVVAHAAPLIVGDLREHPELREHPAVQDGRVVAYAGVPLTDGDGHVLGVVCASDTKVREWSAEDVETLADIAESARSELRLLREARRASEAEERFRQTFDAAPIGMGTLSPKGRWIRVNRALSDLTGHSPMALRTMRGGDLTHPEDREEARRLVQRLLAGTSDSERFGSRYLHADGRTIWVDVFLSVVRDADGMPQHLVVQVQDVTERRRAETALRTSEERFRMAMRHAPAGMAITVPATGEFLQVNQALCEMLGRTEPDLVMRRVQDLVVDADHGEALGRLVAGELPTTRLQVQLRHAEGGAVDVQLGAALVRDADDRPLYVVAQIEDVTERKRLLTERQRFFEVSMDMLAVVDADGRYMDISPAFQRTLGFAPEEMLGRHFSAFVHPEDLERSASEANRLFDMGGMTPDFENRVRCKDGSYRWLRWSSSVDPETSVMYCVAKDVTERLAHEAELVHLAAHDPLTGLLNRRAFAADLEAQLVRTSRYERGGALLLLDLDDFKTVNDTLGHRAGDELIVGVSRVLREAIRESDVLARLGGDEFAVLLPEGGEAEALEVAEKLVAAVRGHVPVLGGAPHRGVTVSIGVTLIDDDRPADDLLAEADIAMYDAKERGGDQCALAGTGRERVRLSPSWPDRIRAALDGDGFELYAQPIIDVASGVVTQQELLLRLRADNGEPIAPAAFLPAAERHDLIGEIDRWVVGQAIDMLGDPLVTGGIEVNVSERSVGDPRLLELIARRLGEEPVDPTRLVLEITEAAALADIDRARRFGDRVAQLGCRLALDDFGAGFGSFHHFEHLPFHFLKIDGDYVTTCLSNRTDRLVVDAVVSWAHELGKRTIAEFTPDAQTLELLRELGVDLAQGHHIGRPRPLRRTPSRAA